MPPCGVRGSQLDDWVDRPDVEAQQCVELTGTNEPMTCYKDATRPLWGSREANLLFWNTELNIVCVL